MTKLSIKIEINTASERKAYPTDNLSPTIIETPLVEGLQSNLIGRTASSPNIQCKSTQQVNLVAALALLMLLAILASGGGIEIPKFTTANVNLSADRRSENQPRIKPDEFRQLVALEALSRAHKKEKFRPGIYAQCMFWVRSVLESKGVNLPVSKHPFDESVRGNVAAPGMAQSLSGSDIGRQIHRLQDLKPGDLVFYLNTYGNDPPGSITHVGIYVGNGKIVHRPTASGQVTLERVTKYKFGVGVRIHDKFLKGAS